MSPNTLERPAAPGDSFDEDIRVRAFVWVAPEGGFAIARALDEADNEVTLTGPIHWLPLDDIVQVRGQWTTHKKHGLQVRVAEAYPKDPVGAEGARRYLRRIKNIGPRRAEKLVRFHGAEVFEVIDRDPFGAFLEIPGLSDKRARAAATDWHDKRAQRELYTLLSPHGLSRIVPELHRQFGAEATDAVRDDPYGLTRIHGVGFLSADRLARVCGVLPNDPARAHAAAHHLLQEAGTQGHSYLPADELVRRAGRLLGQRVERHHLTSATGLEIEGERVYRADAHRSERWVASWLRTLSTDPAVLDAALEAADVDGYSDEQRAALERVFTHRLSVITGGPGTGKSTLTKGLVERCKRRELSVLLCAPTGRAARRLSQVTGMPAFTMHKALDWTPGFGPQRHELAPIEADVIVVDEASMVSLDLARQFLPAVPPEAHLVLIGDANQLAPVGPGRPFADLVEAEVSEITRLTHVFRQAARSLIVRAAHAVNAGERPPTEADDAELNFFVQLRDRPKYADPVTGELFDSPSDVPARRDRSGGDLQPILVSPAEVLARDAVRMVSERIPEVWGLDPIADVQVISPMYRGPVGVDELNERIRAVLNPDGARTCEGRFRVGDKVISTKNAYDLGLTNGTLARITDSVSEDAKIVLRTDMDEQRELTWDEAAILRPGFATTVHRTQGAEVPAVVCICHSAHQRILCRELLYTAITRAQKLCIVLGDTRGLAIALSRVASGERHSALVERLRTGRVGDDHDAMRRLELAAVTAG